MYKYLTVIVGFQVLMVHY